MTDLPTVFVVDDDPDLCAALQWLITTTNVHVETYTTAREFLELFDPRRRGCLVLDIRMREMDGLQLFDELRSRGATLPVIILTGHGDVSMAVRTLKDGVFDFFQKPVNDTVLLNRIQEALEEDARRRSEKRRGGQVSARIQTLTRREREVMMLVVDGRANKQIARELEISEKTVEVHRKRMMHKMQAASAVDLVNLVRSVDERLLAKALAAPKPRAARKTEGSL